MLKLLSGFSIDHHSREIYDKLPLLIELNLPNFPAYLQSRLIETPQTKQITSGCLDPHKNLYASKYSIDSDKFRKEVFES